MRSQGNHWLKSQLQANRLLEITQYTECIVAETSADHIKDIVMMLKREKIVQMLICLHCADYPGRSERFELTYNFLNIEKNARFLLKTRTQQIVQSISSIFSNASWYEREVWDMYGLMFSEHTDLRRIITDYGFVGHPMRKDFPLTGYMEVHYDADTANVIYDNVKLEQDYRDLNAQNQCSDILPGDEKATIVGK